MTLMHPLFSTPIFFNENEIQVLIIENQTELRAFIFDLRYQINGQAGESVLAENFEPIEISNLLILLTDIFSLDFTSRKLLSYIFAETTLVASNFLNDLQKSTIALNRIASEIAADMEFDISFNELTDPTSILKQFNFFVDISNLSYVEQLTLYIKFQQRFFHNKLVVLYNLKACLSPHELELFYQAVLYEKLSILLIEDIQRGRPLSAEHLVIIDKDLCAF